MTHIAFTGHRDKQCNPADLEALAREFPGAVWVHGGAVGFDTQVECFARRNRIDMMTFRPDYARYGNRAPLERNKLIVCNGDFLVALWDGRETGGTWFTICYARQMGKEIRLWKPPAPTCMPR